MLDYYEGGDPAHPTILLIHRGGVLHRMWEAQLSPLEARFHVLAPDLYYPDDWARFTVEAAAADVLAVIREAGGGAVVLVGAALGASVAMQAAMSAPDVVRGMVLVAPRVRVPPGAMRLNRLLMRLLPRQTVETAHVRAHRRAFTDISDEAAAEMYQLGRAGLLAASRAIAGTDFSGALPGLPMPILTLIGKDAPEASRTSAVMLAQHAPNARLMLIEGAGTWVNLEQPEAFNQAVTEFVDGLDASPARS